MRSKALRLLATAMPSSLPRSTNSNTALGRRRFAADRRRQHAGELAPQLDQLAHAALRTVWWHSIAGAAVIGLIALLQAYVFTGLIPK